MLLFSLACKPNLIFIHASVAAFVLYAYMSQSIKVIIDKKGNVLRTGIQLTEHCKSM